MSTPEVPTSQARRRRVNPAWPIAVVVLSVALVALGVWTIADRQANQPRSIASDSLRAMLEDRITTYNAKGGAAVAGFYADDAVLEEHDVEPAWVTTGAVEIGRRLTSLWKMGMRLNSESTPIEAGGCAAEALSMVAVDWRAISVYERDENGKIVHQWVIARD